MFTVLELKAGYYGVGIEESSHPCTPSLTKNCNFQLKRLNMGYINLSAFFRQTLYRTFASEHEGI